MAHQIIAFHPEVQAALHANRPVVALESTLITHGFAYPQNLQIARQLEQVVKDNGAAPATIAIIEGKVTVGLSDDQLAALAQTDDARKCSVRDLPLALARGEYGSTTVAATMVLAHRAGIAVFATGGIGGVHRGMPYDISADLMELGRTPITVICAGMKAFLDLAASIEVLETQAVPVIGYQTDDLPAFFSRRSGLAVDLRVETPAEAAALIAARDQLQLSNAILLTAPVPSSAAWPAEQANSCIEQALAQAEAQGIKGKDITPFILSKIAELSEGQSIQANMALLVNNAIVAARVAVALKA